MLKFFLNLVLQIVLGSLKSILLKNIQDINAENLTNDEKRKAVFEKFKADAKAEGKVIRDSLLNLVIEAGVTLLKDKLK